MSYFPNAFKQVFVAGSFVTDGKTEDLTAGQVGFFNAKTWSAVDLGTATITDSPEVVLAMGSYRTVDKVGTHGGYKESIKSKIISPRSVHRFWKVKGRSAQQQIVQLGWDGDDNSGTSPTFVCGKNYNLRIDLKGSPALRFLTHNMYHTFSVFTGCCTNVDTPESVDPTVVLLDFAKQINEDALFSQFVSASVIMVNESDSDAPTEVDPDTYVPLTDSGEIAAVLVALQLTVAYVDTKFGDCSFEPRDHFELEPLVITSAQLTDESGDPCSDFTQLTFTETQAPQTADGSGEMILRDLIMSNNYRQEIYQTDPRMREAEDINSVFTNVSRTGLYDTYYILYTAARKSNPTGVYDNDQYLIQLSVPEDTDMSAFESWFSTYMTSVPTGVALEDLSGVGA